MRYRGMGILLAFALLVPIAHASEEHILQQGKMLVANLELAQGKSLHDGVVLMTHGTLAHGRMEIMASLQQLLKERGLNSLSITLSLNQNDRHGMYDCATPHTHKHTNAIKEIGLWLAWLKKRDVGPVTLLGHSRGGNQTAWFASEYNDPIIKDVVLMAPATWNAKRIAKEYQQSYHTALSPIYKRAQALVKAGKGDTLMMHTGFLYCPDATVSAATFVNYYKDDKRKNTPYLLKHISKPVLVIVGSEDTVVPDLLGQMKKRAAGKHVKLVVIDGAGHFFRDLYAEDAVDNIVEFMGQ